MSHRHLFLQVVQIFVCGLVSHVQDHLAVFSPHSLCLDDFLLHQAVCWDKPGLVRIKTYMRTHSPPHWPSSSRITHRGYVTFLYPTPFSASTWLMKPPPAFITQTLWVCLWVKAVDLRQHRAMKFLLFWENYNYLDLWFHSLHTASWKISGSMHPFVYWGVLIKSKL